MQATQCTEEVAAETLSTADNNAKLAILMILTNTDVDAARKHLAESQGYLRGAIGHREIP